MKSRKLLLILAFLSLGMTFLTACSSKQSVNKDKTPATLQKRYLGSYRSDNDNATYFDESTNEFDFDTKNSTISDGTGIKNHIIKYQVLAYDDLNSKFHGDADKYNSKASKEDTIFYLGLMTDDGNGNGKKDGKLSKKEQQSAYEIILSKNGKNIQIISLGKSWDDFVFTGKAENK